MNQPVMQLNIDGETIDYDPLSGEVMFPSFYRNGSVFSPARVYRTGRGVVKVMVDGASHRLMDVIYQHVHGVSVRGFQCYPKNGDFSDLRADNIIMVRSRESLFGRE